MLTIATRRVATTRTYVRAARNSKTYAVLITSMATGESERAAADLVGKVRRERPRPSRALWIVSLTLGTVLAGGFLQALRSTPDASSHSAPQIGGGGFGLGLLLGGAGGFVVGWAIARQRRDHSSRKTP